MFEPGKVVYATRDVAKGSVITADSIIEKDLELSKIPSASVIESQRAVGKKAKYQISEGTILSKGDFENDL